MKNKPIKSPKQTMRAYCQHCLGLSYFNSEAVSDCQGNLAYMNPCPFFPFRMGKRLPIKVFRAFCLDCMNGVHFMVRDCKTTDCPIHHYRFGKNPARSGQGRKPEVMERARHQKASLSKEISTQNK